MAVPTQDIQPFLEVIGVARDSRYDELTEEPRSFVYLPHLQSPDWLSEVTLLVRAQDRPSSLMAAVQHEIRSMDPNLPVYGAATLEQTVGLRSDMDGVFLAEVGANGDSAYTFLLPGAASATASSPVPLSGAAAKTKPEHPLAVSDPLSAGQAAAPGLELWRTYLPMVAR